MVVKVNIGKTKGLSPDIELSKAGALLNELLKMREGDPLELLGMVAEQSLRIIHFNKILNELKDVEEKANKKSSREVSSNKPFKSKKSK